MVFDSGHQKTVSASCPWALLWPGVTGCREREQLRVKDTQSWAAPGSTGHAAGHESPLACQGVWVEKAFSSQSRLLFCQLLASKHGRKHCGFFHLFCFQCNFFLHFPVQWRVCEGKKNEVPALAFLKKGSPAALFSISHHKSVWIGYKPKSHGTGGMIFLGLMSIFCWYS